MEGCVFLHVLTSSFFFSLFNVCLYSVCVRVEARGLQVPILAFNLVSDRISWVLLSGTSDGLACEHLETLLSLPAVSLEQHQITGAEATSGLLGLPEIQTHFL